MRHDWPAKMSRAGLAALLIAAISLSACGRRGDPVAPVAAAAATTETTTTAPQAP